MVFLLKNLRRKNDTNKKKVEFKKIMENNERITRIDDRLLTPEEIDEKLKDVPQEEIDGYLRDFKRLSKQIGLNDSKN